MTLTNFSPKSRTDDWLTEDKEAGIFSILAKIYADPNIYQRERAQIFDKSWLYAAHDSEIPSSGNFVTRHIGGRELLIVRGKDGRIRAFLNACRHKGAPVCRERSGNASMFRCAYHAWNYNNLGKLVGVPAEDAYGPGFEKSKISLFEVRLESYRGLLFTCYDKTAVSFKDYIAGAVESLDLILDKHEESGVTVLSGGYQYNMSANWKVLMENSMDAYHLFSSHIRFFNEYMPNVMGVRITRNDLLDPTGEHSGVRDLGNGHSVSETKQMTRNVDAHKLEVWEKRFGAERAKRMLGYNRVVLLYPNTMVAEQFFMIRTCFPLSADVTQTTAWALAPNGEDPKVREIRMQNFSTFQGPAGFGTPDDIEILEQCQRNFHAMADDNYLDSSRGMSRAVAQADDELANRVLLREWHRQLTGSVSSQVAE
jgi:p-cumate 2,3-dioxygenase alpha subunit